MKNRYIKRVWLMDNNRYFYEYDNTGNNYICNLGGNKIIRYYRLLPFVREYGIYIKKDIK